MSVRETVGPLLELVLDGLVSEKVKSDVRDRLAGLVTVAEAADMLGLTPGAVTYHVRQKRLGAVSDGTLVLLRRDQIEKMKAQKDAEEADRKARDRKIVDLSDEGLSNAEIARRVGCSQPAVRIVLLRERTPVKA